MAVTEWVIAVATVALVMLTAAYAWQTRLLVTEMRATREEGVRPAVRLTPEVLGVNYPVARITNVGPGHAIGIEGRLSISIGGTERWAFDLRLPLLVPGGSKDFIPRLSSSEQLTVQALAAEPRVFHMAIGYRDPVGRQYRTEEEADWRVVSEHMWGAGMLRGEDPLGKIEKHAERIARAIDGVTSSTDGVRVTTYRERKMQAADWQREWAEQEAQAQAEPDGAKQNPVAPSG